jgi:hypothetical protein
MIMPKALKTKTVRSKDTISPEDYKQELQGIMLDSIRQVACECTTIREPDGKTLRIRIDYVPKIQSRDGQVVRLSVKMVFTAIDEDANQNVVRITSDYEVKEVSKAEFTDNFFEVYKVIGLPVIIWPYFREYVQNQLVRMSYPPFTLPVIMPGVEKKP